MEQFKADINKLKIAIRGLEDKSGMRTMEVDSTLNKLSHDDLICYYDGLLDEMQAMSAIYDYDNQAWIEEGRYSRCGHPNSVNCKCYGKLHEGEIAPY